MMNAFQPYSKRLLPSVSPLLVFVAVVFFGWGCSKNEGTPNTPAVPEVMRVVQSSMDGTNGTDFFPNSRTPQLSLVFSDRLNRSTVQSAISFTSVLGANVTWEADFFRNDSGLIIRPSGSPLSPLSQFNIRLNKALRSTSGAVLDAERSYSLVTPIDSSRKFPLISDDSLMTLVQKQTFRYFWDFGHPVSGMARERNSSGDLVTSGGTGFGIMSMLVAVHRGFITRAQARTRITTIADFLKTKATRYKGAFAHWMNGNTGATIPFSANDNGADLVETSFLMMGLLTAREFFNDASSEETTLRQNITELYNAVEWDWFRRNGQNVLYWHWSPDKEWTMNLRIQGWNECLITYVLAAGSPTHSIPKEVYTNGWARNGDMRNGNTFYGVQLPLGSNGGGPLFLSHYSFLGINPEGLSDPYANYATQNRAHSLVNYNYCVNNPLQKRGYSSSCWGLTASDIPGGYTASSPTNDRGVIAPTAAIGSMPYTPQQSMEAMRFFYYTLGYKIWGEYGFIDAFSIHERWFASSTLAIDQGPQIIMIENHRSKLIWNLGMQIPEIRNGLTKLGFSFP